MEAMSTRDPERQPGPVVLPTRDDPLVRASSEGIGGPAGSRVWALAGWWTPLRVCLVLVVVTSALGYVADGYCRAQGWPRNTTVEYSHACYSDLPHLFLERGLSTGAIPYLSTDPAAQSFEYPVLSGAIAWLTALVANGNQRVFFDVNVLVLAALAVVTVWATAQLAGRRPWDAAIVAAAPTLLLAATINWDLLAIALTALALLAWARRHPVLAGVLLGLGTAAKLYPLFVLGPLLVLCLRADRMRAFGQTLGAAVVAWTAVNLPVAVVNYEGWIAFFRFNVARAAEFGSPWYALEQLDYGLPDGALNPIATLLFAAACAAIAWLGLSAQRRPRLPQLVFLVLAAFLVTNKVYSPQYVLWLLPLAALARPRWRDIAIWQACEVVYFFAIWLYLNGFYDADRGLRKEWYALAVFIHIAGTAYLAWQVLRDIREPWRDPVRADGIDDDPAGGVLDGAPDRGSRSADREPVPT
jgi:uncharacterized membrane protein